MVMLVDAALAQASVQFARRLRLWLLLLIGADSGLAVVRALSYPAFFSMPGTLGYLVAPLVALALYAAIIGVVPRLVARMPAASTALRVGTAVGLLGATVEVISLLLESVWTLSQRVVSVTSGVAMLTLFLLFGIAGGIASGRTGSFRIGLGSALCSAAVAILVVVTVGFLLVTIALPTVAHNIVGDPDFVRSGWTDARAFAIANTYDSAVTHLVEAPVIAAVLGSVGSALGRAWVRWKRQQA